MDYRPMGLVISVFALILIMGMSNQVTDQSIWIIVLLSCMQIFGIIISIFGKTIMPLLMKPLFGATGVLGRMRIEYSQIKFMVSGEDKPVRILKYYKLQYAQSIYDMTNEERTDFYRQLAASLVTLPEDVSLILTKLKVRMVDVSRALQRKIAELEVKIGKVEKSRAGTALLLRDKLEDLKKKKQRVDKEPAIAVVHLIRVLASGVSEEDALMDLKEKEVRIQQLANILRAQLIPVTGVDLIEVARADALGFTTEFEDLRIR